MLPFFLKFFFLSQSQFVFVKVFQKYFHLLPKSYKISLLRTHLPPYIWNWVITQKCPYSHASPLYWGGLLKKKKNRNRFFSGWLPLVEPSLKIWFLFQMCQDISSNISDLGMLFSERSRGACRPHLSWTKPWPWKEITIKKKFNCEFIKLPILDNFFNRELRHWHIQAEV